MMDSLHLYNFDHNAADEKELGLQTGVISGRLPFILETCQRKLIVSSYPLDCLEGDATISLKKDLAYVYLLEMLCGLKSRLVAENEIVNQFKQCFNDYLSQVDKDKAVAKVLQKLLQDNKNIRNQYLRGISQKTYAALTRKILKPHLNSESTILIFGTGNLAEDLINQFKKYCRVILTGRNAEKTKKLAAKHGIETHPWRDFAGYQKYSFKINSIGTDEILFNKSYLTQWRNKHESRVFIDLSHPSPVEKIDFEHGEYHDLIDIYKSGAIEDKIKWQKINQAKEAIVELSQKRHQWFQEKRKSEKKHIKGRDENLHDSDQRKFTRKSASYAC
ncbi:MAG: hypothetical protein H6621_08445 [Halobacteriovoraceae bacterium]|nr:hypothetical protein [Halobacteriovoraceae bacterium]MCB9095081.1 hypothetical protein [Halobacteriovoraceae bacterium]